MSIWTIVIIMAIAGVVVLYLSRRAEQSHSTTMLDMALDVAVRSMDGLGDVQDSMDRLRALKIDNDSVDLIRNIALMQLTYIHDMIGMMVAFGTRTGEPPLGLLVTLAHGKAWNWSVYVNSIVEAMAARGASNDETVELRAALTNTLVPMQTLRDMLQQSLRAEGVEYHGVN